jgi:hypothetical protein
LLNENVTVALPVMVRYAFFVNRSRRTRKGKEKKREREKSMGIIYIVGSG